MFEIETPTPPTKVQTSQTCAIMFSPLIKSHVWHVCIEKEKGRDRHENLSQLIKSLKKLQTYLQVQSISHSKQTNK